MALSVDDRLAIRELLARYCHALDVRDPAAIAATFTEDGVLESSWPGMGELRGRAAIERYFREGRGGETRHWVNNPLLEGDGERARLRLYLLSLRVTGSRPEPIASGRYDDDLRKVDGRWLFAHRRITFDQPQ